jgi:triacylglycerol lipase
VFCSTIVIVSKASKIGERLPSVVSLLELLPNGGGDGRAFESLTLESMKKFNESTPDAEAVEYFSWGAEATPGLLDPFR